MFEPFVQVDNPSIRTLRGTRLESTICRWLARALGGDNSFRRQPGKRSTFTLILHLIQSLVWNQERLALPNAVQTTKTMPDEQRSPAWLNSLLRLI